MARLIVCQKNGMSPEEAWRQETERDERSTDALIDTLQKLYDAMARLNRDLMDITDGGTCVSIRPPGAFR